MCEVGRVVGLGDVRKVVQLAVGGGDHRAGLADQVGQQLVGGDQTPQDGEERPAHAGAASKSAHLRQGRPVAVAGGGPTRPPSSRHRLSGSRDGRRAHRAVLRAVGRRRHGERLRRGLGRRSMLAFHESRSQARQHPAGAAVRRSAPVEQATQRRSVSSNSAEVLHVNSSACSTPGSTTPATVGRSGGRSPRQVASDQIFGMAPHVAGGRAQLRSWRRR